MPETPMSAYANVHMAFEQMRVRALAALHNSPISEDPDTDVEPEAPRVLVLGPENSGKTTVCKILVNYAVRAGQSWAPLLANVDPSEGGWSCPGAISAAPIRSPLPTCSPANPLGSAATSAPTALSSNALLPLVYWYGHNEVKRNPLLLDRIIRNLGENVNEKWEGDPEAKASGIIVDTPSSFASGTSPGSSASDHRHTLIKSCIDAFRINTILVVGHEKLNVEMARTYGARLSVVKIPKSGGVVELDLGYRERVHRYQLHTYMYGQVIEAPPGVGTATLGGETMSDLVLSPSSIVLGFDDLAIYRIGEETMAPTSALPIGGTRILTEMQPIKIDPAQSGSGLLNAVLALLAPFNPDEAERYDEEILDLTVAGFLVVTHLDMAQKKMTLLAPSQGTFTGRTAVIGSFEWQET
ncbi:hypothetical protein HWV62_8421 [Athelia sp. TMB]|nr:hypothetical protein HWV62_8421 [Athelia sp. TMB]